jgi:hypothetical protein
MNTILKLRRAGDWSAAVSGAATGHFSAPAKDSRDGGIPRCCARGLARSGGLALLLIFAALAPGQVFACAACYGRTDDAMAVGMNWAILTLGVIVTTVLGAFLTFLIYVIRKSEAVEAARVQAAAAAKNERLEQPV